MRYSEMMTSLSNDIQDPKKSNSTQLPIIDSRGHNNSFINSNNQAKSVPQGAAERKENSL